MRTGSAAAPVGSTSSGSRFRQRKLNVKAHLQILREADLENGEASYQDDSNERNDSLMSIPKVESGVEGKEEKEHHLQAVISASAAAAEGGKVAQIYIPTPDAIPSNIQYHQLYPSTFAQPSTYIRFSSTVEDSVHVPYCMMSRDVDALNSINSEISVKSSKCSEDQFEEVINFFEEISQSKQPFASVDNTPVLSLENMEAGSGETLNENTRRFLPAIYNYWKDLRLRHGNKSIAARLKTLKMETGQDMDDSDPYVCFRRREIRLARKTRGRDAQIVEKLRKLRKELEDGRQILDMIKKREFSRRDEISVSRKIFEQRYGVRDMKHILNIQEDEDLLLINQKTPKRRQLEPSKLSRPQTSIKLPNRNDKAGLSEFDPILLRDKLAQREQGISSKISKQIVQHENWNTNYLDRTEETLLGLCNPGDGIPAMTSKFWEVKFQYVQPATPPLSASSGGPCDIKEDKRILRKQRIRWVKSLENPNVFRVAQYRTRMGRAGRLIVDRHLTRPYLDFTGVYNVPDQYRFDSDAVSDDDDDDDDDDGIYAETQELHALRYKEYLRQKEQASFREQHQPQRKVSSQVRENTRSDVDLNSR